MRLWILALIVVTGFSVTLLTFAHTCRRAVRVAKSGTNGSRWTLLTGDLIDDVLRLVGHVSLMILLGRSLVVGPAPSSVWTWRAWVFVAMIVSLSLSSINRWYTTRALIAQQAEQDGQAGTA